MEGVFGYYCSGQITAVCRKWHSMDGSGFPLSSGKVGWDMSPGLTACKGWDSRDHSPNTAMQDSTTPGGPRKGCVWLKQREWLVPPERWSEGQNNAHGAKESCSNWEGKGRERNVKTTQTFLSLQGCRSPACSSGGITAPLERDLYNYMTS